MEWNKDTATGFLRGGRPPHKKIEVQAPLSLEAEENAT